MCQLGTEVKVSTASGVLQPKLTPNEETPEPCQNSQVSRQPLPHSLARRLTIITTLFLMATTTDPSQRPRLPVSQSFRNQATQDALAEIPPSARATTNGQGPDETLSATAIASKLEGVRNGPVAENKSLDNDKLHHRLNASGSVQAIVVDGDVLFAGLQGGDIVVSSPY